MKIADETMLGGAERAKGFVVDRDVEMHSPTSPWSSRERLSEIIYEFESIIPMNRGLVHPSRLVEVAKGGEGVRMRRRVDRFEVDLDGIADLDLPDVQSECIESIQHRLKILEHHRGVTQVDA